MNALSLFRQVVENRFDPDAVDALASFGGRPVIGFLDTGFPEELAIAAGFHPMLLTGDPSSGTATVDPYLDLSVPSRVRHLTEAMVTGRHDSVDVLCVTGGDRWLANTHGFLEAYRQISATPDFGDVYYLERVRGTYREHRDYNLRLHREFRAYLEDRSGNVIDDGELAAAISLTNETRALLRDVAILRTGDDPRISGVDAHTITMASMLMPKKAFNAALRQFLASEVPTAPAVARDSTRVFLSGSSLDHQRLHEIVESLPAVVVGEDTEFGARYAETPINESIDPMEAIADRYTFKAPESWAFGIKRRIAMKVDAAVAARADVEVFLHLLNDTATGWDFPDQRRALQEQGIHVVALTDQDYAFDDAQAVSEKLAEFISHSSGEHNIMKKAEA
ncbi:MULTISPECIES: 2-hydroxyacyl-CoA dehydratase family protein [Arthrobacter]|uniref:2-hydroxyacyl-CoA dehydratase family protein n=1 Tax=Arthrobacter TaxID=1663 RepID=UPI001404500B|nr:MULTISPECIES: 2-hydroxyacyl-CoA dehydratase family protein [Arthrobacter]MBT8159578.1 2-hydroxyacyl-CoA dehydratase family protein [Arthrobacter sp. GN70]